MNTTHLGVVFDIHNDLSIQSVSIPDVFDAIFDGVMNEYACFSQNKLETHHHASQNQKKFPPGFLMFYLFDCRADFTTAT